MLGSLSSAENGDADSSLISWTLLAIEVLENFLLMKNAYWKKSSCWTEIRHFLTLRPYFYTAI